MFNLTSKYHGGRPKRDFRSASKEQYNKFILENPEITITYKDFENITRSINKEYAKHILETGDIVKLPYGLGSLTVRRKKRKTYKTDHKGVKHINLPVNWKRSIEEGKLIYHLNDHTGGNSFGWYWIGSDNRLKCGEIWKVKIAKRNSILLSEYIFNDDKQYSQNYVELDFKKKRKI